MQNRTAQIQTKFIAWLIAIFVLIILVITVFLYLQNSAVLPTFNNTKPLVEELGIIRYDITTRNVEYFTGEAFVALKPNEDVLFNRIIINENTIKIDFENFWYVSDREQKEILLNFTTTMKIAEWYQDNQREQACLPFTLNAVVVPYYAQINSPKGHEVLLILFSGGDPEKIKRLGLFTVTLENNLWMNKVDFDEYCNTKPEDVWKDLYPEKDMVIYNAIVPEVVAWRDAVLKKPLAVRYVDRETNQRETVFFCVTKMDSKYLVIDFSKPKQEHDVC